MSPIVRRVVRALRTLPDRHGWGRSAMIGIVGIALVFTLALAGGLLELNPIRDPTRVISVAALLFFVPALGEEMIFRAALIPRASQRRALRWVALSVVLFILWHPLQVVTIGPPWSAVFLDPWFLAATGVLGLTVATQFLETGSVWPCVITHWIVVAGWKLLLGGPF